MTITWRDPPDSELGAICCRCFERMTPLETVKAPALANGMLICPRCEHPRPRLVQ